MTGKQGQTTEDWGGGSKASKWISGELFGDRERHTRRNKIRESVAEMGTTWAWHYSRLPGVERCFRQGLFR